MNEALKPFLARSFAAHLLAAAAFVFLVPRTRPKLDKVYMIDFVGGPTATITSSAPSAPAAAPARTQPAPAAVAPQADPDAVAVKGKPHAAIVLPRPSLLTGGAKEADEKSSPPPQTSLAGSGPPSAAAATAARSAGTGGASAAAGAGVSTDLPNFPYPWYISQVRLMLWQEWQKRMPRLDAEGAVSFSILRNGSCTDLAVESSSGDGDFDKAAVAAVQGAAPFPALPTDFREPFLKIHLSLKSEEAWR
jgi:protein TonB